MLKSYAMLVGSGVIIPRSMHVYGDETYKQYTDGECDIKTLVKVNRAILEFLDLKEANKQSHVQQQRNTLHLKEEYLINATCKHDNYDEKLKKFKENMKLMSENLFQTSNTRPFEEYKNYSKNSELLTPE